MRDSIPERENRRVGRAIQGRRSRLMGWALLCLFVLAQACQKEPPTGAKDRILIEIPDWQVVDNKNIHAMTIVNGNDLAVRRFTLRIHYLDGDGAELAYRDVPIDGPIAAHDAVRQTQLEAGKAIPRAARVTYEVRKVWTTLVPGQKR